MDYKGRDVKKCGETSGGVASDDVGHLFEEVAA